MRALLTACVAAAALAVAPAAHAATGSDGQAGAALLTLGPAGQGAADTSAFTAEPGEPMTTGPLGGCPRMARTAWWKVRGNGHTLVLSTAGSNMDTEIAVYEAEPGGATATRFKACHADVNAAGGDRTSLVSVANTRRGQWYLVQVGSQNRCSDAAPCYDSGTMVVRAEGTPRPANDDRAAALALPAENTASGGNVGATTEPDEDATCGPVQFAATVWFRWTAPAAGVASFDARASFTNVTLGGNTVLAVYRGADGARLACNDDAGDLAGPSRVTLPVVAQGTYLMQIGAGGPDGQLTGEGAVTAQVAFAEDLDLDDDGASRQGDCNDADPGIAPGRPDRPDNGVDENCDGADAVDLDRDRDGVVRPIDCDDANPAIRPGARDVPRNRTDEDCRGGDARWPQIASTLKYRWRVVGARTTLTRLEVRKAVAGARVTVRCDGKGCPFARRTRTARRDGATIGLLRPFRDRALKPGARIRVDIAVKEAVSRRYVLTTRRAAEPKVRDRCIEPGGRPRRC